MVELGTGLGTAAVCAALLSLLTLTLTLTRTLPKPKPKPKPNPSLSPEQVCAALTGATAVWATDIEPRALAFAAANAAENGQVFTAHDLSLEVSKHVSTSVSKWRPGLDGA